MSARKVAASIGWSVGMVALGCVNTASGVTGTGMDAAARTDATTDVTQEDRPSPQPPPPFRLRSPISNHAIGTSRPVLRWFSPDPTTEHVVTICADRRCETVQDRQTVRGLTTQPTGDLPRGLHYWFVSSMVNGATLTTPVWMFRTTWATDAEPRTDDRGSAADFNGDGYSDVVVLHETLAYPEVIYGGSGALTRTSVPAGSSPNERIAQLCGAADFNGDGYDDLAVWASSGQGYVSAVLLGSEEGLSGLRRMPSPPGLPVARRINSARHALRRGDLDQDGYEDLVDTDLVYQGADRSHVRVIWGGIAQAAWQRLSDSEDNGAVIFDINQDGIPDLLSMRVYLDLGYRTSLGPFDRNQTWTYSARRDVTDITLCDLDHDRIPDLIGDSMEAHLDRYGIAGWLRGPGGSETPIPRLPGRIYRMGCLSTDSVDRLIYSPFIAVGLKEATLQRSSETQSPRLIEVPLVFPQQSSQGLYPWGPTGSFIAEQDMQSLVLLRSGTAGMFVDVMSIERGGATTTIRQSIRVADWPRVEDALL